MTVAILTGAAGALGQRIALQLASCGIELILVGRNKDPLLRVASDAKRRNGAIRVTPLQVDLMEETAICQIISYAREFGGIDILINAAAVLGPVGKSWMVPGPLFADTFRLNFLVPAALCSESVPLMINRGAGWIINISGGGATSPRPMFSAYGAAKTALVRFSETLAHECTPYRIRVNSVAPGAFRSKMTEGVLLAGGTAGPRETEIAEKLLKEDSGAAERAADLVAYLVAGPGKDISGKLISAIWDDWSNMHTMDLNNDIYTLRRIVQPSV